MASIDENILEDDGDGYDYEYDDIDGEREKALLEDDDDYNNDTQADLILHEEVDLDEEEEETTQQNREHKFTTERNAQPNEQKETSRNFHNQPNRVPFRKNFPRRGGQSPHKYVRRRIHLNPRFSPRAPPASNNGWNAPPAPRPWIPQPSIPIWNNPPPIQNVWPQQPPPLMQPPQFPPPQVPHLNNQWYGGNGYQNQNYTQWNVPADVQYPQHQFNQQPFCQNSAPVQHRLGFKTEIFTQSHQSFPPQPPPQPQPVINFNNYAVPTKASVKFFPRKKFKPAASKEILIKQNICVKQATNVVQPVQVKEPEVVDPKETDEEREYRIKIQEQKRLREKVLAEKERKRKLAAEQQQQEAQQQPQIVKQQPQQQRQPPIRAQKQFRPQLQKPQPSNFQLKTQQQQNQNPNMKSGIFNNRLVLPGSNNIHIQCVDSTSTFFNERTILAKDTTLPDTRLVVIKNLSDSTNNRNIISLCKPIGDIEKLHRDKSERQATILFKSVASAHAFYKKYQRYMLDLSMIEVLLKPE